MLLQAEMGLGRRIMGGQVVRSLLLIIVTLMFRGSRLDEGWIEMFFLMEGIEDAEQKMSSDDFIFIFDP